jgi:hypothetical protein
MQSCIIPNGEPQDPGPSIEKDSFSRLDHNFDFQIVIFKVYIFPSSNVHPRLSKFPKQVENTLFKVPRNGFKVPGTPFEAMFTLPQAETDNIEGSSLENPIHLPGVSVDNFRSFLRILYPLCVLMISSAKYRRVINMIKFFSIDQTSVDEFGEYQWIGVLNLATMWVFEEVRSFKF